MQDAIMALLGMILPVTCFGPMHTDLDAAGPDYVLQGEYRSETFGMQVISRGDGRFDAALLAGGLPGAGWDGTTREWASGRRSGGDGGVDLAGDFDARVEGDQASLERAAGRVELARVERRSPTLEAAPPPGAVVLFDGSGTDAFEQATLDGEVLGAGAATRDRFGSFTLHVEFATPFQPEDEGQSRGNSGVYLQGRYEVQVLDSFGLPEGLDDCGAVYKVAPPKLNMSLPPLQWQTYDIDFTAAAFDAAGTKTADARTTVRHNGTVIHDDLPIPAPTGQGEPETAEPGPILFQDHWNPVRYRNIWLIERGR